MDNRKWQGKSRGGAKGNLFFVLLIRYMGIRCAYIFLCIVIPYFILFAPTAVSALWDFYRRRLGYSIIRSIFSVPLHFYEFGQVLIDKTAMTMGLHGRYKFEFENYNNFLDILNSDSGVMIIGAHIGNWECGAPFFGKYGKKINIVMLEAEHRKIKEVFEKNSHENNYKVIPLGKNMVESMIAIKCALNNKEYICMQGDRFMSSKPDGTSYTAGHDFLGSRAEFPQGPFMLAKKLGVPVVFYFATRCTGRKYLFRFIKAEREKNLLEQYAAALEKIVKENPRQWFNFYKFWEYDRKKHTAYIA